MLRRHRTGGNREEARQARFRRERVVVRGVEAAVGDVEADREQLPLPVEQEVELRFLDQLVGEDAEPFGALDQARGVVAGPRDGVTPAPGLRALQEVITPRHQGGETGNACGRRQRLTTRIGPAGPGREPLEVVQPAGNGGRRAVQPVPGIGHAGSNGTSREQRFLRIVIEHADCGQPIANLRQQPRPA